MLTFPVETMALLTNGEDVIDKAYKDLTTEMYAAGHSFFTYLSDNPDSLASCCFDKNEQIIIIENDYGVKYLDFETAYNNYGDSVIKTLQLDPYTLEQNIVEAKIVKTSTKQWYTLTGFINANLGPKKSLRWEKYNFIQIKVTPDHILPILRDGKIIDVKAKDITDTDSILLEAHCLGIVPEDKTDMFFDASIYKIETETLDTEEPCYCLNVDEKYSPYFVLRNGLITHNCRLRNQINENVFSFTNGLTGVQTGSCNVITINLNRLTQDACRGHEFDSSVHPYIRIKNLLTEIVERVHKYHIAYKTMLYE